MPNFLFSTGSKNLKIRLLRKDIYLAYLSLGVEENELDRKYSRILVMIISYYKSHTDKRPYSDSDPNLCLFRRLWYAHSINIRFLSKTWTKNAFSRRVAKWTMFECGKMMDDIMTVDLNVGFPSRQHPTLASPILLAVSCSILAPPKSQVQASCPPSSSFATGIWLSVQWTYIFLYIFLELVRGVREPRCAPNVPFLCSSSWSENIHAFHQVPVDVHWWSGRSFELDYIRQTYALIKDFQTVAQNWHRIFE